MIKADDRNDWKSIYDTTEKLDASMMDDMLVSETGNYVFDGEKVVKIDED